MFAANTHCICSLHVHDPIQLLLTFPLQIYTPEVLVVDQLEDSVRGAGGFGSTGA